MAPVVRSHFPRCTAFLAVAAAAAILAQPLDAQKVRQAPRAKIIETAKRYTTFEWTGSAENIKHGADPQGVHVDTPDKQFDENGFSMDGKTVNRGMPYAWGGFTSIEDFQRGLDMHLYAGNVPRSERAGASKMAMGLDCSGFVARAWDLPTKQSTRSLGALCYPLESVDELLPGDILNKFDSHVVLFKNWEDDNRKQMRVVEAARLKVEENVYPTKTVLDAGFVPMRYKPLDARWVEMGGLKPTFEAGDQQWGFAATPGAEAIAIESLPNPLRAARARDWTRYRVNDNWFQNAIGLPLPAERTQMVAKTRTGEIDVQSTTQIDASPLMTGATSSTSVSFTDALIDFVGPMEPLNDMRPVSSTVTVGEIQWGPNRWPAKRIETRLEGSTVMRHKSFPVTMDISCVVSDHVPMHGIVEASFTTETIWETDADGTPAQLSRRIQQFKLLEFGRAAR